MDLKYTIQSGDTLSQIAVDLGVEMKELAAANQIEDANKIRAGKKLIIPPKKEKQREVDPAVIQKEMAQQKQAQKAAITSTKKTEKPRSILAETRQPAPEKISEPFLPSNVRQFLYDLAGGEETFTEKDLKAAERKALADVVKAAKSRKSNVIEYEDYQTTGKGSQYEDVGGSRKTSILSKISDPAYSLKTLIGQANITEDEDGNTLVVDRYNFNDAESFSASGFVEGAVNAGASLYKQARNVGKFFGSGEGKGSPVVINLGNLKV